MILIDSSSTVVSRSPDNFPSISLRTIQMSAAVQQNKVYYRGALCIVSTAPEIEKDCSASVFIWMNTSGSVERHVQDTIVPSLFDIRCTALDLRYLIYSADNMIAGTVKQNNYDYTLLLRMQARKEAIPDLHYTERDFRGLHVESTHSAWFLSLILHVNAWIWAFSNGDSSSGDSSIRRDFYH